MFAPIDTRHPTEVEIEVQRLSRKMFPEIDRQKITSFFDWFRLCFEGKYRNYQPIDARYHDMEHTLQGTLCLIRILYGRHKAGAQPPLTPEGLELVLLAIVLHDTGYLKTRDDQRGTGAKYTPIHVDRSAEFAALLLGENGYSPAQIRAIQNMIYCTGVKVDLDKLSFSNELERILGFTVGTADLLGQMAADDYVEKLPILYSEFEEAARANPDNPCNIGTFSCVEDLMRKTASFWKFYAQKKIKEDFRGLYRFLSDPYPDGPNWYIVKIEQNLKKLEGILAKLPSPDPPKG